MDSGFPALDPPVGGFACLPAEALAEEGRIRNDNPNDIFTYCMKLQKFGHSCVLLEENGKRLLFDPGAFAFIEGTVNVSDIGLVDVVVLTHTHPDHYAPDVLKELYTLSPYTVVTHQQIADQLAADGVQAVVRVLDDKERVQVDGFDIAAHEVPHEQIPIACPHNFGYVINGSVYHPGDSYMIPAEISGINTLLLPTGGPWATTLGAVRFVEAVKPKRVAPIHDAMHKQFWLERLNASMAGWMQERGVEYAVLGPGESIEV